MIVNGKFQNCLKNCWLEIQILKKHTKTMLGLRDFQMGFGLRAWALCWASKAYLCVQNKIRFTCKLETGLNKFHAINTYLLTLIV